MKYHCSVLLYRQEQCFLSGPQGPTDSQRFCSLPELGGSNDMDCLAGSLEEKHGPTEDQAGKQWYRSIIYPESFHQYMNINVKQWENIHIRWSHLHIHVIDSSSANVIRSQNVTHLRDCGSAELDVKHFTSYGQHVAPYSQHENLPYRRGCHTSSGQTGRSASSCAEGKHHSLESCPGRNLQNGGKLQPTHHQETEAVTHSLCPEPGGYKRKQPGDRNGRRDGRH